jgi:SAM-dependent methyltransferase
VFGCTNTRSGWKAIRFGLVSMASDQGNYMSDKKTKQKSLARRMENGRLAFYRRAANAEYWDKVWATQEIDKLYKDAEQGELGYYQKIFPKYLVKERPILEAGCGLAQFVIALRRLGYDARGVDYGAQTVSRVKEKYPDLPIEVGDVTSLKKESSYYAAYISLGVMEHDRNGPDLFLQEARRLLETNGVALISVPYLNPIRKLKAKFGLYRDDPDDLEFYQYAYGSDEFATYLNEYGFIVEERFQYGGYKGIKDEIPLLSQIFEWPQGWRIKKFLMHWNWADRHMGHMMLFVARKA